MKPRLWTIGQLQKAAKNSTSIRQVLQKIGLREAGGNYAQIKKYLALYKVNTNHFKGKAWNKGMRYSLSSRTPLKEILVRNSNYQSYKLKSRLFSEGFKKKRCEICGWAKESPDGRLPLELDHINGDSKDNRLENLRILCPNCHSLQLTHRGRNKRRVSGGIGIRATLKMSSRQRGESSSLS